MFLLTKKNQMIIGGAVIFGAVIFSACQFAPRMSDIVDFGSRSKLYQYCKGMISSMPQPLIVLGHGYKVRLGNDDAEVYGRDEFTCNGEPCTVLIPEVGTIKAVDLVINGSHSTEQWMFLKSGDHVVAIRPNGEMALSIKRTPK